MKTNTLELYLSPTSEALEIKAEGVICGSELQDRGDYDPINDNPFIN